MHQAAASLAARSAWRGRSALALAARPLVAAREPALLLSTLTTPGHGRRDDVTHGRKSVSLVLSTREFSTFGFFQTATRRKSVASSSSTPQPPPLPSASIVKVGNDCALEYIDLPPRSAAATAEQRTPTLVLLHGAPGTYRDFRHLIPQLQQQIPTARIVGINFPGFGGSTVDEERYFELLDAQRAAQLTLQALQQLVGGSSDARVVLVGHSFGGHAALSVAALNLADDSPLAVSGLVLLAAAGTRPHRVLRPRQSAAVIRMMQSSPPFVRHALAQLLKIFYTTLLRFPSDFPASHYVAGILRAGTTDFNVVSEHVARLRAARVRSLSAWSSNDEFMEDEIPTALASELRSDTRLAFRGAGHNLQKTRAADLAREIALWVERDASPNRNEEADVEVRP